MKVLAEVEIRCRDHDSFDSNCSLCCLLKRTENNLQALRSRRSTLLEEIKRRLSSRELAIIGLR
jgi:hypothetical protein